MSAAEDAEGFAIIPRWLQQDETVPGYVKLVYLALASHVNRSGITSLSHKRIAAEASCSVPSVKRALNQLRDLKVLSWEQQRHVSGTGQTSNLYTLVIGQAAYSRPNVEAEEMANPGSPSTTPSSPEAPAPLTESRGVALPDLPKNESQKNESQKNEISLVTGSAADQVTPRSDVLHLVKLLAELLAENGNAPKSIPAAWSNAARLLLDSDGITLAEAEQTLRWCQADTFWAPNVLSMPTFRKRYIQLRAKMRAEQAGRGGQRPTAVQHNLDLVAQIRAEQGAIR
jgi:hypothetical protein